MCLIVNLRLLVLPCSFIPYAYLEVYLEECVRPYLLTTHQWMVMKGRVKLAEFYAVCWPQCKALATKMHI